MTSTGTATAWLASSGIRSLEGLRAASPSDMNDASVKPDRDLLPHKPPELSSGDLGWAKLDTGKIGRYGEYFAKMALVRAGYDVYAPEVDDKAIDLIIRVPDSPPRYFNVQVKTVRTTKPTYVFMRKKHFTIEANRYLALVLLHEGREPSMDMIPATVWTEPKSPFTSRDYEGLKSEPEYGVFISAETMQALEAYRF